MPHRITGLSKRILDVIEAEKVPTEIAFAALSRAAISMCSASDKSIEWFTHTTLKTAEELLIETVRRPDQLVE